MTAVLGKPKSGTVDCCIGNMAYGVWGGKAGAELETGGRRLEDGKICLAESIAAVTCGIDKIDGAKPGAATGGAAAGLLPGR